MKSLFDNISYQCSKAITKKYSTSFSLGILFLAKKFHAPIYNIYGFVRAADEIVDSFHGYDQTKLLYDFRRDTMDSIVDKISINPILNSFQEVVHNYTIEWELIEAFLKSMEMDLHAIQYDEKNYNKYIFGSAEAVGLMCLRVFTEGDSNLYEELKPFAQKLGAAFQKVNFLRDVQADYQVLGRTYFPNVKLDSFGNSEKREVELDIKKDFDEALLGIKRLPKSSRRGVYLAYIYYISLFKKIKSTPSNIILNKRIRIPNRSKFGLMFQSMVRHELNLL